jgi:hypothetical protein
MESTTSGYLTEILGVYLNAMITGVQVYSSNGGLADFGEKLRALNIPQTEEGYQVDLDRMVSDERFHNSGIEALEGMVPRTPYRAQDSWKPVAIRYDGFAPDALVGTLQGMGVQVRLLGLQEPSNIGEPVHLIDLTQATAEVQKYFQG